MQRVTRTTWLAVCLALLRAAVFAQGGFGGFSGAVRDTSGAVLPGVTVEASSDALIEKVRTVVTDAQGQYKITDLRPGTYALKFTLAGFSAVVREGLVLTSGTTIPYNAELKVGALEETLTVTGETPVVDVQSTRSRVVLGREVLDSIPRSRDAALTAALLPGVNNNGLNDMGGSGGGIIASLSAHGSDGSDQFWAMDGMKGGGGRRVIAIADQASSEVTYEVSGLSAETQGGGVRMNTVPKEGGNTFSGVMFGAYTGSKMTSSNLTDDLKKRGLTAVNAVSKVWDVSPALGGPIRRDRLWFFLNARSYGSDGLIAGTFLDSDPTKQSPNPNEVWDANVRLTWQITPKNKISGSWDKQGRAQGYRFVSPIQSPEAGTGTYYPAMWVAQSRWTAPLTSRVLFEAAASYYNESQDFHRSPPWVPGTYPHLEITTNKLTGAASSTSFNNMDYINLIANMSYVTGSHAFKAGFQNYLAKSESSSPDYLPTLRFNNGVPFQVVLPGTPTQTVSGGNHDIGLFAQDQWTMKRVTLNLGVRLNLYGDQLLEQNVPAGTYIGPSHSDAVPHTTEWQDVSPRLGVAWDVFGNGKTAIKASFSHYLKQGGGYASSFSSVNRGSDTRTWTDRNGDGKPTLDELGPSTNLNFGINRVTGTVSDDVRYGWQKRPYNVEYAAVVQHELMPGLGASVGYYRRAYGNFTWTDNTLINQSDYTPFTITSPIDGERITMYNLNVAKRGLSQSNVAFAPDDTRVFDGIDITVAGKFGHGVIINGGVGTGRIHSTICTTDDPNRLRYCDWAPGFFAQNQYKAIFVLPTVKGWRTSGTFLNNPGIVAGALGNAGVGGFEEPGYRADYTVTSALAGVTLTNGSITIPLLKPGEKFPERRTQVDFRVARTFRVGSVKYDPAIDFYNLFNASSATGMNFQYGPLWNTVTAAVTGRVIQVSATVTF